jgi:hypothetical protein
MEHSAGWLLCIGHALNDCYGYHLVYTSAPSIELSNSRGILLNASQVVISMYVIS